VTLLNYEGTNGAPDIRITLLVLTPSAKVPILVNRNLRAYNRRVSEVSPSRPGRQL
jgi:hypothetical protein